MVQTSEEEEPDWLDELLRSALSPRPIEVTQADLDASFAALVAALPELAPPE